MKVPILLAVLLIYQRTHSCPADQSGFKQVVLMSHPCNHVCVLFYKSSKNWKISRVNQDTENVNFIRTSSHTGKPLRYRPKELTVHFFPIWTVFAAPRHQKSHSSILLSNKETKYFRLRKQMQKLQQLLFRLYIWNAHQHLIS